jgi:hypothetical protein
MYSFEASTKGVLLRSHPEVFLCSGKAVLTFTSMQGWGNILNLAVLLFFLGVQGQTGPQYSFRALSITWRMQYALGLLPIIFMLVYRVFYLKESSVWQVSPPVPALHSLRICGAQQGGFGSLQSTVSADACCLLAETGFYDKDNGTPCASVSGVTGTTYLLLIPQIDCAHVPWALLFLEMHDT